MFWTVLQWISRVIALILEAEVRHGPGAGAVKKADVVDEASGELDQVITRFQIAGCPPKELVARIGAIVDSVVDILNCLGALPAHTEPQTSAGLSSGAPGSSEASGSSG